ncbi:hypothetical protein [Flavobacterium caeni]|uniref:DUF4468 domain-containing protein n=1 Tax=Flavobacterium caeni TaxID=490189 RepID=A0A1G5IBJ8_9FLAO|nr:hypothetical protein [Flavobacterium caeni]SCY72999.1 hypothetical protein SAMN02927903_02195 [Flavobacterium caeni]
MKKISCFLLGLICFPLAAQSLQEEVQHPDIATKLFKNPKYVKDKSQGSPYKQIMFAQASVEKLNIKAFMRYNAYKDEFEFITPKSDTLVLDKIEDFDRIVFTGLRKQYELIPYTEDKKLVYGYLVNVHQKDGWTLYRKERVSFVEAKPAKTSLEVSMPAKFSPMRDIFFLRNKEGMTTDFPESKKALVKLFPAHKDKIDVFVKQAQTNFDNESDLIQLVNFLATL